MKPVIHIEIDLMPDNQINVKGFPDNKIVSYGLLEVARGILDKHFEKNDGRLVQPVDINLPKM